MNHQRILLTAAASVAVLVALAVAVLALATFKPWLRAMMSGAPVSLLSIVGMRLRGTPPLLVIDAYIQLHHRGAPARLADVERMFIANRQRVMTSHDLVDLVEQGGGRES